MTFKIIKYFLKTKKSFNSLLLFKKLLIFTIKENNIYIYNYFIFFVHKKKFIILLKNINFFK